MEGRSCGLSRGTERATKQTDVREPQELKPFNSPTTKCLGLEREKKKKKQNQETANILHDIETICKNGVGVEFNGVSKFYA